MQEQIAPNQTFSDRTDLLARRLKVNVVDLMGVLDISKSTLFLCRKDDSTVSRKTWLKLAAAEAEAGIGQSTAPALPELQPVPEPSNTVSLDDRMGRLETLFEELLAELRGKDNQATSSKARGEKFN